MMGASEKPWSYIRVQVEDIIASLPDDATWDEAWQQLTSKRQDQLDVMMDVPEESSYDLRARVEDIIASLPDDATWDEAWQQLTFIGQVSPLLVEESVDSMVDKKVGARTSKESRYEDSGAILIKSSGLSSDREEPHEESTPLEADNHMADEAVSINLRKKGIRYKVTAVIVLFVGLAAIGVLDAFVTEINQIHKIIVTVYTFALLYLTYRIHLTGRYYAQKARELHTGDNRAPILYLRSFTADTTMTKVKISSITEEEQIVGIFSAVGPVIALDNPVKEIMAPGAKRFSVTDEEWQNRVLRLMHKARLIVIRLGDTPSLHWEITHAIRMLKPEQLLFIVPQKKLFDFERFTKLAESQWGIRVQNTDHSESVWQILIRILTRGRRFQDYYSFRGFVYFDDEWNGRFSVPKLRWKGYLYSPLTQPGRADIVYALKPFFQNAGVLGPMLQFNWGLLILVIVFAGGGIVGLLSHIFGFSF
jgi:hypothetical protein